jgi:hypothetical protein
MPAVNRTRAGMNFVMSLATGDAIEFPVSDRRGGVRIVDGVWAAGVVVTLDHADASTASVWRPSASTIVKGGAQKFSVDPIGRLRRAGD